MAAGQIVFILIILLLVAYVAITAMAAGARWYLRRVDVSDGYDDMPKIVHYVAQNSPDTPDEDDLPQTETQTDQVSAVDPVLAALKVDKTRPAVVAVLVKAGWDVGQIRAMLKGDNGAIGVEAAAARQRLGLALPPEPQRQLAVQDHEGKRVIPFDPIKES